jgi:hypothetical protein
MLTYAHVCSRMLYIQNVGPDESLALVQLRMPHVCSRMLYIQVVGPDESRALVQLRMPHAVTAVAQVLSLLALGLCLLALLVQILTLEGLRRTGRLCFYSRGS